MHAQPHLPGDPVPSEAVSAVDAGSDGGRVASKRQPPPPQVFLDCAASSPIDPVVADRMRDVQQRLGANPSSVHKAGLRAAREVELARIRIAERLGVPPETLSFTGCATEANNWALKGALWATQAPTRHLVVSSIEHPSILETARWLEQTGQARVSWLPVDAQGRVRPADLAAALQPDTVLVSVMHVNNEVGTVQPIAELGRICRDRGVLFHTDACQGFLKVDLDLASLPVDLVSINAHKVHGPKGVGALYQRPGVQLAPLLHGGGHEQGQRSGTLNVAGISGFGEAVVRYTVDETARITALRDSLLTQLGAVLPQVVINSPTSGAVANILNLSLPGHSGKKVSTALDRMGIRVSASSACHSTRLTPSHVLLAMGFDDRQADQALRISLGRFTTEQDLRSLLSALGQILCSGDTEAA